MERLIPFTKIEAAGNDFIFVDTTDEPVNAHLVKQLCTRHFSIGADGLILMDGLRMRYFNADGSEGSMCGNGLRAAVLFSYIKGKIPRRKFVRFEAKDGMHRVRMNTPNDISVEIIDHRDSFFMPALNGHLDKDFTVMGFFNTGVPHVVLKVSADLRKTDVEGIGKKIRFDSTFEPEGTNVNFITVSDDSDIQIRTYERGVEKETLACGTGAVAAFLALEPKKGSPLTIQAKGGRLTVYRDKERLFLNGSARISFVGQAILEDGKSERAV